MIATARRILIETRDLPNVPELSIDPHILSEDELLHLKTWLSPVDESLWAKLQEQTATLRLIEGQRLDSYGRQVLSDCASMMDVARACIERHGRPRPSSFSDLIRRRMRSWVFLGRRWPFTENNSLFWRVVHEVDENMMLIMPREMLAARALAVLQEFKLNISDRLLLKTWLGENDKTGPLEQAVSEVQKAQVSEQTLLSARHILREALHEVNEQSDRGYRQLALNMLMRTWSGVLLAFFLTLVIASSLGAWPVYWLNLPATVSAAQGLGLIPPVLLLLGSTGAVLANMVARKAFVVAAGPTRRYFVFYLVTRPVVGAFAAFLLYLLLHSKLLVLNLPLGEPAGAGGAFEPWDIYTYSILAVAAGYSAERFLGATIDKLMNNLFKTADKSQRPAPAKGCGDEQDDDRAAA